VDGNSTRAAERVIWTTFIDLLVPPTRPAATPVAQYDKTKAIADKFLDETNATFANRNCEQEYQAGN
jgi:hypothetical protein